MGSVGGVASTVKPRLAGVASVLSELSVAATSNVWPPSASSATGVWVAAGPEQDPNESVSKRHSKVDPASSDENAKVGVRSFVKPEGPELIEVSGGSVSSPPSMSSCGSPNVFSSSNTLAAIDERNALSATRV